LNCAIILASGNSTRFKGKTPKQFNILNGRMVLDYPVETFSQCEKIDKVIIVVPEQYCSEIQKKYFDHLVVPGGLTRRESTYKGILSCPIETKNILIHDAARALVDKSIINRCINSLKTAKAVSTIVPSIDTVVETNGTKIVNMPNRNQMFLEQTPQGFDYHTLLKAHNTIHIDTTDDIRLVYEMGINCQIVEGSFKNYKITTQQDLHLAEILLKEKN